MGKVLDYMGDFRRSSVECRGCGWSGLGSEMKLGDTFGDGAEFDCPKCGKSRFVQWSIVVGDEAPDDWPAKVPRVEF